MGEGRCDGDYPATAALDLGADLSRRADTLLAAAPGLRTKPATIVVDLLLAEDCVSSPEAARIAAVTERSARRLFERLVTLGAARELSGRATPGVWPVSAATRRRRNGDEIGSASLSVLVGLIGRLADKRACDNVSRKTLNISPDDFAI